MDFWKISGFDHAWIIVQASLTNAQIFLQYRLQVKPNFWLQHFETFFGFTIYV